MERIIVPEIPKYASIEKTCPKQETYKTACMHAPGDRRPSSVYDSLNLEPV